MDNPKIVVRKVSEGAKNRLSHEVLTTQEQSRLRAANIPEPFGLNRLYDGQSPLSQELTKLLTPCIRRYVLEFFENKPKGPVKGSEYWRKFIPDSPSSDEYAATQLALSPKYFWVDFMKLPEIRRALVEDAAYTLVDSLVTTVDFLEGEKRLVNEWQKKRPQFYDYANKNSLTYINKVFPAANRSDADCAEGLSAVWLMRMAAFRILDAHFTGNQTYRPNPRLGGVDFIYRKLQFHFASKMPSEDLADLEKRFSFIKIGDVETAEYGLNLRPTDQMALELAFAETDYTNKELFSYSNLVTQVSTFISPILSMQPEKVRQKGLVSVKFLYQLYEKAKEIRTLNECQPIPELDLQEVFIDLPELGEHVDLRFSSDWCRKHFISPAWLSFAGFRPVIHKKSKEALELVLEGIPEFAAQLNNPHTEDALVTARTRSIVLEPVLARGIQRECLLLFKDLHPKGYEQAVASTRKKYRAEREVDRISADSKALHECFLFSVEFLVQNQERTIQAMKEKFGVAAPVVEPVYVSVPPTCNWVHPSIMVDFT